MWFLLVLHSFLSLYYLCTKGSSISALLAQPLWLQQHHSVSLDSLWYAVLSHSGMSNSLQPHGLYCSPPGSSVHRDSPSKNIGVGCYALLQGIFPTQGLNSGLPHCRQILYCLSYQGSQKRLNTFLYKLVKKIFIKKYSHFFTIHNSMKKEI